MYLGIKVPPYLRYRSYISWTVFFLCNMSRPSSLVIQWHRVLVNPHYPLKLIHKYSLVHLIVRVGVYWQFSSKMFFTIILVIFHTVKFLYTYKLSLGWFSKNLQLTFPPLSLIKMKCDRVTIYCPNSFQINVLDLDLDL